jgi:hypothetical protein
MYYNLCHCILELAEIWNLGYLIVSLSISTVRFSKKALTLIVREIGHLIWNRILLKVSNNLGWREYILMHQNSSRNERF